MFCPQETRYTDVPYRRCGNSGLLLPPKSLGTWQNFGGVNALRPVARSYAALSTEESRTSISRICTARRQVVLRRPLEKIFRDYFRTLRNELIIPTKAGYVMWPGP
jgi:L-glyceraldehyde 3-phosphate reductase